MTLQQIIEQAVAAAFAAGAEWHAIVQCRQDSAKVGRQQRQWEQDPRYQQALRHHQRQSAEAIGRAIMRLTVGPTVGPERKPQQRTLFNGAEGASLSS